MAAVSGKNVFLLYIIIILVILAVNIIGGYFISQKILNYAYSTDSLDTMSESKSEEESPAQDTGLPGTSVPLDPINLNPAGSTGEIFSCTIVLEVKDPQVEEELKLQLRKDQIMDKLSGYLSLKTVQELGDAQMWDQYRKEMTDLVNSVLSPKGKISNLYIREKIIQFP